jgi:hypothetical protein
MQPGDHGKATEWRLIQAAKCGGAAPTLLQALARWRGMSFSRLSACSVSSEGAATPRHFYPHATKPTDPIRRCGQVRRDLSAPSHLRAAPITSPHRSPATPSVRVAESRDKPQAARRALPSFPQRPQPESTARSPPERRTHPQCASESQPRHAAHICGHAHHRRVETPAR